MAHRQWCDRECDSPRDQSSPEGSGDLLAPHKRGGGLATPRVLQGGEMEEARDSSSYVDPRRCWWCPSFVEQPGSSAIPPATRHDQLTRPTSPASAPANDPRRRGPATSEPANRSCTDTA